MQARLGGVRPAEKTMTARSSRAELASLLGRRSRCRHLITLICPLGIRGPGEMNPYLQSDPQAFPYAGRLPSLIASHSLMYLPCLVFPYQRVPGQW